MSAPLLALRVPGHPRKIVMRRDSWRYRMSECIRVALGEEREWYNPPRAVGNGGPGG